MIPQQSIEYASSAIAKIEDNISLRMTMNSRSRSLWMTRRSVMSLWLECSQNLLAPNLHYLLDSLESLDYSNNSLCNQSRIKTMG